MRHLGARELSSNTDLIRFFLDLEAKLKLVAPESEVYFPVIRSHVYFALRRDADGLPGEQKIRISGGILALVIQTVVGMFHLLVALFRRGNSRQLFIAPAQHRNIPTSGGLVSKHLDSLTKRFGGEADAIWEVGAAVAKSGVAEALPDHVSRVALIMAKVLPRSRAIGKLEPILNSVAQQHQVSEQLDIEKLLLALSVYEYSRRYYSLLFSLSKYEKVFIVVYYSRRHLPIIAALNQRNIPTIEYQHGIQNNAHPLYTNWDSLSFPVPCLPRKILLWNQVSINRIEAWGNRLGIQTELIGNLWYLGRDNLAGDRGAAVMVALQHYPRFFNSEILEVIEKSPNTIWLFRQHPIYSLSEQEKLDLENRFSNVEIVDGEKETLEETLQRSFVCITGFSTVGLESLMFGRAAIFTHENAKQGLAEYIDGRECFYADTAEEILTVLKAIERPLHDAGRSSI